MKQLMKFGIVFTAVIMFTAFDVPKGWIKSGSDQNNYEISLEKGVGSDGKIAATIKSIAEVKQTSSGFMMQTFQADVYQGKRIRMTAFVKSKDVGGWAGLLLRIEQPMPPTPGQMPVIDMMADRPIIGSSDWKKYEIVLDVKYTAATITFGAVLNGSGQIWVDNFAFEIVDKSVPLTIQGPKNYTKEKPENLNFEE